MPATTSASRRSCPSLFELCAPDVPNVKVAPLPSNSAKATVAIRGSVTENPAIYREPTVGIYLD